MVTCKACGQSNDDDMPFCLYCGATLKATESDLLGGRFRLGALIGEGGMSKVYLADDEKSGQKVAVKLLKSERAGSETGLSRFLLEIKALSEVHHPALIEVLAVGNSPRPYYVMPYIEGPTLAEELAKNGALPPKTASTIMLTLLAAVGTLHKARLIHRDIKAENVILAAKDQPILLDLGAIKELDAASSRTAYGMIIGTPIALAPEQILGQKLTERTDIYQLGILFSEMLLGRTPFEAENTAGFMAAHLEKSLTLSPAERQISPELMKVALKAMAKNPAERFKSTGEMSLAIREANGEKISFFGKLFAKNR